MKSKLLLLFLFSIILPVSGHALSLETCEQSDDGTSARNISDPGDYSIVPGFGDIVSFSPNEIELQYSTNDCSGDIAYYVASNRDEILDQDANNNEKLVRVASQDGSILTVKQQISLDGSNSEFIFQGSAFILNNYTISFDNSASNGSDPFDGLNNNTVAKLGGIVRLGTDEAPCRLKFAGEVTTLTNAAANGPCLASITVTSSATNTSYSYSAGIEVSNVIEIPDVAMYNENEEKVGYLRFTNSSFQFLDLNKEIITN